MNVFVQNTLEFKYILLHTACILVKTLVESGESKASPILPFQRWADCITIRQPDSDKQQLPQSTDNESKAITHSQDTP